MTNLQREGMEAARHELVTLDGLTAADGAAPTETFVINTRAAIAKLDAALNEFSCSDTARS
ncbi:hypothetical protein [Azotobacter beijerinckii]|uniref:Uncharacterized protein n=1 Tax=Azotobacter beijerinckii TaxID=170623 RepID=A0A1I4CHX0_9GAMM|nr:hypothetical protein [Azotobacter beijerinckii]SFB22207.1 hypothetical protein SAMN04244571_01826 [Azotobacter beijerinckii]SFK79879.1 hypothetical protein SAMN04244574_01910 [Azotobacter beijerinckii]